MSAGKITILYVDDEENNLFSFKATFRVKYNILIATSGDEALKLLGSNQIHIIISDQRMPATSVRRCIVKIAILKKGPNG